MTTLNPTGSVPAESGPPAVEWATPGQTVDPLAVLSTGAITYERLPMLEVVADRLQHLLATTMRDFTTGDADVALEGIGAQRLGDWLGGLTPPTMIPVFKALDWNGDGLVGLDQRLIYAVIEALLGSRRRTTPVRIESRPFTTIEATLIERLTRLVLADLSEAIAPIAPVKFRLERTETDPRFAAITRPGNACVVIRMRVALGDHGGTLTIVLPYATLEPARDLLMQPFMGEKLGADPAWQQHLADEVRRAEIELEAVLEERAGTLAEVLSLKVGSVLRLDVGVETPVVLRCGHVPVLVGQIGRRGSTIVVTVEDRITRQEGT